MIYLFNDHARRQLADTIIFAKRMNLVVDLHDKLDQLSMFGMGWRNSPERQERDGKNAINWRRTHRVSLIADSSPYSFGFCIEELVYGMWKHRFNGGLIYSGPLDDGGEVQLNGSFPSFTCSLGPARVGWSIHT